MEHVIYIKRWKEGGAYVPFIILPYDITRKVAIEMAKILVKEMPMHSFNVGYKNRSGWLWEDAEKDLNVHGN